MADWQLVAHLPNPVRSATCPPAISTTLFPHCAIKRITSLEFKVGEFHLDDQSLAGFEQIPFPAVAFLKERSDGAKTSGQTEPNSTSAATTSGGKAVDEVTPGHSPSAQSNSEQSVQKADRLTPQAANTAQEEQAEPSQPTTPILLIKADAERVLYFRPGSEVPEILPLSEFSQHFRTDILLIACQDKSPTDPVEQPDASGTQASQPPFGFRWFIPTLMKHKSVWRDVLLASLTIQIIGLVTPLLTQVLHQPNFQFFPARSGKLAQRRHRR